MTTTATAPLEDLGALEWTDDGAAGAVSKAAHKILKAVGEDIEKLGFNRAIARIYERANALTTPLNEAAEGKADAALKGACREAVEILVHLIAPVMPHLAEECWETLGGTEMVAERPLARLRSGARRRQRDRAAGPGQRQEARGLTIARDANQGAVEKAVLALDFVQKGLEGKAPRKVIIVPQRIGNVVA